MVKIQVYMTFSPHVVKIQIYMTFSPRGENSDLHDIFTTDLHDIFTTCAVKFS